MNVTPTALWSKKTLVFLLGDLSYLDTLAVKNLDLHPHHHQGVRTDTKSVR
jgi:hypothetical protein